jgi:hypothetical protein
MTFSAPTLIAAARALDESRWHLGRIYDAHETLPQSERDAPELLIQTERALEEVESRYSDLRASEPALPEFKEWIGYTE